MAGGLFFFDKAMNALSTTKIGNVSSNFDGLGRDDRVRYDTPNFYGFSAAASAVADDKLDAALTYGRKFGDFKTTAAVGYSEPKGSVDYRISGSASVLHASGVNVTLAAGTDSERSSSRNDPWSIYAKLGYIVDWQKFGYSTMARVGKTALAVDYHYTEDEVQDGDEFTSYGMFLVQNIDQFSAEAYLGWRTHDLERPGADFDNIDTLLVGGRVKF